MRTALYVLLALAAPAFAGQTVYKWVDEKGVTHFSDQPVSGAEKVELSGGANRSADSAPSYTPPPPPEPVKKGPAYSRFVVESPQQDETFVNTAGVVSVRLASSPPLDGNHLVSLYLDGAPVKDFPSQGTSYEFSGLSRGSHTVKAVVSTLQGMKVQETPAVTFHVRQESGAQPPVGPNMRPNKPKRTAGNKLPTEQPTYAALNGSMPKIDPRTNRPVKSKPQTLPAGPKDTVGSKDPKDSTPPPNAGK
ncbi:MAG TPA: DUF4124 domain-containing protein [Steroidobacter sp.]|uniref:DUF4124 domain-containing protein n=1 Tax=Steroidobacter sp. TaxID=1978227 RepID=UPI002ED8F56F